MLVGFQFVGVAVPFNGTALVALATPRFDSLEPKEASRGFTFPMTGSRVVVREAATQITIAVVNTALADERHIEQTSTKFRVDPACPCSTAQIPAFIKDQNAYSSQLGFF